MWAYVCPAAGFMLVSRKQYLSVTSTDSLSPGTHVFTDLLSVGHSFLHSFVCSFPLSRFLVSMSVSQSFSHSAILLKTVS